jgi:two-component system KDP operon response regulator KdpE
MGRIALAITSVETRQEIRSTLEREGHHITEAETASDAIAEACSGRQDLLITDAIVDGIDSYVLCRTIRAKSELGIIVLDEENGACAVDALNAGADDCVAAPFVMPELAARVRAMLRRVSQPAQNHVFLKDRVIDLDARQIKGPDGRVSHLTPKEFQVLHCLVTYANKPRTHQGLAQMVWQRDGSGEVEYMRIVVKQLRRKLEPDPDNPRYILTERSVGYRFHMPSVA